MTGVRYCINSIGGWVWTKTGVMHHMGRLGGWVKTMTRVRIHQYGRLGKGLDRGEMSY